MSITNRSRGGTGQPSRLTRQLVDLRDESSCVRCGRWLPGTPASRHHRKRRSQSSRSEVHSPANLILLCGTGTTGCHGWVHAHPGEAREYGWLLRSTDDPETTPMLHRLYGWVTLDDTGNVHIIEDRPRKALT